MTAIRKFECYMPPRGDGPRHRTKHRPTLRTVSIGKAVARNPTANMAMKADAGQRASLSQPPSRTLSRAAYGQR